MSCDGGERDVEAWKCSLSGATQLPVTALTSDQIHDSYLGMDMVLSSSLLQARDQRLGGANNVCRLRLLGSYQSAATTKYFVPFLSNCPDNFPLIDSIHYGQC